MKSRLMAHRAFLASLTCGAALRVLVMLGYRWQMWFPDSYYLSGAMRPVRAVQAQPLD